MLFNKLVVSILLNQERQWVPDKQLVALWPMRKVKQQQFQSVHSAER
jgi:hypothetical protein